MAGFSEITTKQSIQQLLQHELVSQVHSRELDPNAIAGDTISHDRLCPHASAGHFKRQPEFRTYGRWIGRGNEQTSHTQGLDARKELEVAVSTMPTHIHSPRQ